MCDPGFLRQVAVVIAQRGATPWWAKSTEWIVESAQNGTLQWACRECLGEENVTQGRPWLQSFTDSPPHLAYFDKVYGCELCGQRYVFSAQEQRFWYEELKFWVNTRPKQCADCRRLRRTDREAMRTLQQLLSGLDESDPLQLARVAGLYLGAGMMRKAFDFLKKAKAVAGSDDERSSVLRTAEMAAARG